MVQANWEKGSHTVHLTLSFGIRGVKHWVVEDIKEKRVCLVKNSFK